MLQGILWVFSNILSGFVNLGWFFTHLPQVFDFSDKPTLIKFIYYGASAEMFFAVFDVFLILFVLALIWRPVLWGIVRVLEGGAIWIGRIVAWAGLLMVVQQILIILLQRFFRVADITISPFGYPFTAQLGWYSDELKLYNALIVALACAYTFTQGGHVRVDLVYANLSHRLKRSVDMFGSIFFILPMMILIWLFGWFYLWRHLVTPPLNATDAFALMERKAGLLRWNVQTTSFSPSGFNGYFLFKALIVAFAGSMFVQGFAFFFRSLAEFIEGPESAGKYLVTDAPPVNAEPAHPAPQEL
jgi:TRAP-type mannitol/chloroaromatic compound transport system permease small subunit